MNRKTILAYLQGLSVEMENVQEFMKSVIAEVGRSEVNENDAVSALEDVVDGIYGLNNEQDSIMEIINAFDDSEVTYEQNV